VDNADIRFQRRLQRRASQRLDRLAHLKLVRDQGARVVTGPYTKTIDRHLTGGPIYYREWYRSNRRDKPLPYKFFGTWPVEVDLTSMAHHSWSVSPFDNNGGVIGQASSKAYDKLMDSISKDVNLVVNFAERKQAYAMILARVTQLRDFSRAVRRLDVSAAWRALGVKRPRGWRAASRSFGSHWLEYHFGWEPLVNDIYNAVGFLNDPLPSVRIRGRGKSIVRWVENQGPGQDEYTHEHRITYGADVSISDPDLFLLNKAGLLNPALVAWELVPFSFVIDWFANVGGWLASLTSFVGLSLQNEFSSSYGVVSRTSRPTGRRSEYVSMERSLTLPQTRPMALIAKNPSLTRGVTAISLLTLFLRDNHTR